MVLFLFKNVGIRKIWGNRTVDFLRQLVNRLKLQSDGHPNPITVETVTGIQFGQPFYLSGEGIAFRSMNQRHHRTDPDIGTLKIARAAPEPLSPVTC